MSHKRALAAAALWLLEGAASLHMMMGASYTRFPGIIAPTFEAAVTLLSLCSDGNFPENELEVVTENGLGTNRVDFLGARASSVTRHDCMQAVRGAVGRLETLAMISNMAEVGARNLASLLENVDQTATAPGAGGASIIASELSVQVQETWSHMEVPGYSEVDTLAGASRSTDPSVLLDWGDGAPSWPAGM